MSLSTSIFCRAVLWSAQVSPLRKKKHLRDLSLLVLLSVKILPAEPLLLSEPIPCQIISCLTAGQLNLLSPIKKTAAWASPVPDPNCAGCPRLRSCFGCLSSTSPWSSCPSYSFITPYLNKFLIDLFCFFNLIVFFYRYTTIYK